MAGDGGGGGQTRADPSGWTVDTVRQSLSQAIDATDGRIDYERQIAKERFGFIATVMALLWFTGERAKRLQVTERDREIAVQKAENEKHFAALNHENARVATVVDNTISKERYEGDKNAAELRLSSLDQAVREQRIKSEAAKTALDEARGAAKDADQSTYGKRGDLRAGRAQTIAIVSVAAAVLFSLLTLYLSNRRATPVPPVTVTTTVPTPTAP